MADTVTSTLSSVLLHTGRGQLTGMVLSCSAAAGGIFGFYNNTTGSGALIFTAFLYPGYPLTLFFPDQYALRFTVGLYILLPAAGGGYATVWFRGL